MHFYWALFDLQRTWKDFLLAPTNYFSLSLPVEYSGLGLVIYFKFFYAKFKVYEEFKVYDLFSMRWLRYSFLKHRNCTQIQFVQNKNELRINRHISYNSCTVRDNSSFSKMSRYFLLLKILENKTFTIKRIIQYCSFNFGSIMILLSNIQFLIV